VPILEQLRPHLEDGPELGVLFAEFGRPWNLTNFKNWRRRVWQPTCDAVGIGTLTIKGTGRRRRSTYVGPSPYALRHTFASTLLASGLDPARTAKILGHSVRVLLDTYTHAGEIGAADIEALSAKLSPIFRPTPSETGASDRKLGLA
jgi:integrase